MAGFSYPAPVAFDGSEKKENGEENFGPTVGSIYNGSKVVDIQVEITDRGTRVRRRSIITLEGGIIMKQDHFKDKKFEEVEAPRRRAPTRTKSSDGDGLPRPSLPKSKSGRCLPKPNPPPSRTSNRQPLVPPSRGESPGREENGRSCSRGRDTIVRTPPTKSKSSDLEEMQLATSQNSRLNRRPPSRQRQRGEVDDGGRDASPEPTKNQSSFSNLSKFLISPKRQPPRFSKSGNDLDALRNSLHSQEGDNSNGKRGGITNESLESTPRKPGSLKKLGQLMNPKKMPDLDLMEQESKSEPFKKEHRNGRKSEATAESNKEKLKSFKEMIASSSKGRNNKGSPIDVPTQKESSRRRSSLRNEAPPQAPRRASASTSTPKPPQREPSLSPEKVQKPSSSSYITGFLDKLYDSYIKDDDDENDSDDAGGYGRNSTSLLDRSLNKFYEWTE